MISKTAKAKGIATGTTGNRRAKPGRKADATNFDALTQEQLARVHGKTGRTIVNWDREDHPRNDDGTYSASRSIEWRLAREVHGGLSLIGERARLARVQSELAELKLAVERGDLAPLPMIEESFSELLSEVRTNALALPYRAAPELAGKTEAECQAILTRAVNQFLDSASHWSPDDAMKEPAGPAPTDTGD